jgi:hypothetical protein
MTEVEPVAEVNVPAPAVRASAPISIEPKPEVMEPELRAPTVVREEVTTLLLSVVPVSVPAAAVTVIAAVPSKFVPLIARAVARAVAVAALPVVEPEEPETLPVTLPVKLPVKVPAMAPVPVIVGDMRVLLVRVSVVALPTKVSVAFGTVIVPEVLSVS